MVRVRPLVTTSMEYLERHAMHLGVDYAAACMSIFTPPKWNIITNVYKVFTSSKSANALRFLCSKSTVFVLKFVPAATK